MPVIDEIWVYVVTESPGEEGIPAIGSNFGPLPLVGADAARMQSYREHAVSIAAEMGKPVRLLRFTNFEVIETFEPPSGSQQN